MNDFVAPVYDPADASTRRDPFPLYEALQEHDPVHWSPALRSWVVTRYEDVKLVLATPTMSSDRLTPFYASLKDERRRCACAASRSLSTIESFSLRSTGRVCSPRWAR